MIKVPPSGPVDARLVILGEAPGTTEVIEGKPFVGASGKILDRGLMGNRKAVRVTNVRKHKPDDGQSTKERHAEIAAGWDELDREFDAYTEARVVLCVGADALRAVLGTEAIGRYHMSQFTRAEADAVRALAKGPVLPLGPNVHTVAVTFHPAFALRGNRQFLDEIGVAIGRAYMAAQVDSRSYIRPDLGMFDLGCDIEALKARVKDAETVCVDVEGRDKVDIVGFGFADGATFVGGGRETVDVVRDVMDGRRRIVGHNLLFDLGLFAKSGLGPGVGSVICDTIAGAALLCPPQSQSAQKEQKGQKGPSRLSLAACVTRWVEGTVNWKNPDDPLTQAIYRASYPSVPPWLWPRLYCGLDVWHNLKMWWRVKALLERGGMF